MRNHHLFGSLLAIPRCIVIYLIWREGLKMLREMGAESTWPYKSLQIQILASAGIVTSQFIDHLNKAFSYHLMGIIEAVSFLP